MPTETILLICVLVAGFYMAWNIGANDVSNAMGTSVGSGALTLKQAVVIAAILEFSGAFFFGSHVSETVQKGLVDPNIFTSNPMILVYGMLAALLASGAWLQLASYLGLPVSTTHSIVGAVVGFGAVVGGWEAVYWGNVGFIVSSWIFSPLVGGVLSFFIFTFIRRRIFYSFHPIRETKKLIPPLIFVFVTILTLFMLLKGLENLELNLNIYSTLAISLILGAVAALIGHLLVKRIKENPHTLESRPVYSSDVLHSLEKAKKHLYKVKNGSTGELQYHSSILVEEVEGLSNSLKQNLAKEVTSSEYSLVENIFGYLQIFSAALMAFAHGANDVANAIGPLAAAIDVLSTGVISPQSTIPTWVLALGGAGIVIGLATWGWRVIETIGRKITELTPTRGFSAEFGAAATIMLATRLGMPISTTHTLVGAVIGVGLARGIGALNLATTRDILISWIVTVPAGAILALGFFYAVQAIFG
jgi:PiT family inorganic phosphate transporter